MSCSQLNRGVEILSVGVMISSPRTASGASGSETRQRWQHTYGVCKSGTTQRRQTPPVNGSSIQPLRAYIRAAHGRCCIGGPARVGSLATDPLERLYGTSWNCPARGATENRGRHLRDACERRHSISWLTGVRNSRTLNLDDGAPRPKIISFILRAQKKAAPSPTRGRVPFAFPGGSDCPSGRSRRRCGRTASLSALLTARLPGAFLLRLAPSHKVRRHLLINEE